VGEMGNNSVLTDFLSRIGLDVLADVLGLGKLVNGLAKIIQSILVILMRILLFIIVIVLVPILIFVVYDLIVGLIPSCPSLTIQVLRDIGRVSFSSSYLQVYVDHDYGLRIVCMGLAPVCSWIIAPSLYFEIESFIEEKITYCRLRPIEDSKDMANNDWLWQQLDEVCLDEKGNRICPRYGGLKELSGDLAKELVTVLNECNEKRVWLANLKIMGSGVGKELIRLDCDLIILRGLNFITEDNLQYLALSKATIECKRHIRQQLEECRQKILKN